MGKNLILREILKTEVICRIIGPWVRTKKELDPFRSLVKKKDADPDSFTYRDRNKNPNPIFNESEPTEN